MIVVTGTLEIAEGAWAVMAPLLRETMIATHLEPGCVVYRFSRDLDAPNLVHIVELWESEAALQGHMEAASFKKAIAGLTEHGRMVSFSSWQGDLRAFDLALPE